MTDTDKTPEWRTEQRFVSRDVQRVRALLTNGRSDSAIVYGIVNAYTQHNRANGPRVRIRSHVGPHETTRALEIKEPSVTTTATRKRRYAFNDIDLNHTDAAILAQAEQVVRETLTWADIDLPNALPVMPVSVNWMGGSLRISGIISYRRISFWWNDECRVTVDEILTPAALANGSAIIEAKGALIPELPNLVGGERLAGGKWELLNEVAE